jgi:hypothetical protein
MSRFYGSMQGNRGEATRQGGTESGISCHVRGWDAGIEVRGYVNEEGKDEFRVFITGGSNRRTSDKLALEVSADHVEVLV